MEKFASFSRYGSKNDNVFSPRHNSEAVDDKSDGQEIEEREIKEDPDQDLSLKEILDEVDVFLETLTNVEDKDKSDSPEVPNSVELLSDSVESMISKYNLGKTPVARFGRDPEDDSSFIEAVSRISKVSDTLGEFPSDSIAAASLNRACTVLQRAMSFLDDEFRTILEEPKNNNNNVWDQKFNSIPESDHCELNQPDSAKGEEFPAFSEETISNMKKIATTMISAGYENECCMVYNFLRLISFKNALTKLGYDNTSIEDVQKMHWESLEGEITLWINVVKQCITTLFTGERKLSDYIFSDYPSISQTLFSNVVRAVVIQLLNFAEAVVLTKRSAEKLFKFLDMYETLRDLIPVIDGSCLDECAQEMISEATEVKNRIGEAAVSIFCDLENSIQSDHGRTPVPSGAVHPLTRYVMNYLKYACEYKDTLEQVFQQHLIKIMEKQIKNEQPGVQVRGDESDDGTPRTSPFAVQVVTVMELLDASLDMSSMLYRDHALRNIFLMNNGRYILQKIKGSSEIHDLMGDRWCRRRSSGLRQYHKNYQRETWSKVLQCLSHEGLQGKGGVPAKQVLKERFKSFNVLFDEIHKNQSTWVVSDEQLQSELRVSISAVMIPAYRSFLGRFKQYLDPGRQTEKYIKYQPDDIETLLEEFFDGNPTSMVRRRT